MHLGGIPHSSLQGEEVIGAEEYVVESQGHVTLHLLAMHHYTLLLHGGEVLKRQLVELITQVLTYVVGLSYIPILHKLFVREDPLRYNMNHECQ